MPLVIVVVPLGIWGKDPLFGVSLLSIGHTWGLLSYSPLLLQSIKGKRYKYSLLRFLYGPKRLVEFLAQHFLKMKRRWPMRCLRPLIPSLLLFPLFVLSDNFSQIIYLFFGSLLCELCHEIYVSLHLLRLGEEDSLPSNENLFL